MQSGYGVTLVRATNDQELAMAVAQRMLVLDEGRAVQICEPRELLDRPANAFVATCVGEPPMNLLEGEITRDGGRTTIRIGDWMIPSWSLDLTGRRRSRGRPRRLTTAPIVSRSVE